MRSRVSHRHWARRWSGGGRPASIDAAQVRAMLGASEIAKTLKIGRASVYRVLEAN
jgi:Helix-turn-helix domain of resolvase